MYFYISSISFCSIHLIFYKCILNTYFNKMLGPEFLLTHCGLHNSCCECFCSRFGRDVTRNVTSRDVGWIWMSPTLRLVSSRFFSWQLPQAIDSTLNNLQFPLLVAIIFGDSRRNFILNRPKWIIGVQPVIIEARSNNRVGIRIDLLFMEEFCKRGENRAHNPQNIF